MSMDCEARDDEGAGTPAAQDAKIKELEESLASIKESLARLQASYENYIKRAEKQKDAMLLDVKCRVMGSMLPSIDALELAIKGIEGKLNPAQTEGLALVLKKFHQTLDAEGVSRINTEGGKFDPELHEAINTKVRADLPEGTIIEEALPGYTLNGRVLRPSKVIVSIQESRNEDEEDKKVNE